MTRAAPGARRIRVGGASFRIRWGVALEGGARGLTDFEAGVITLRSGLAPQEALEVLIHEIVHAGLWAYGHTDSGLNDRADYTAEHVAVLAGRIMSDVLTRSPGLLEMINRLGREA